MVVDDEPLAREGMELNIQDVPSLKLLGMFGTAMAANDFLWLCFRSLTLEGETLSFTKQTIFN